ncbi:MAG: GFA family protein [Caldimonas sp.]
MDEIHQGGCLCGSVRYKTIGQPIKVFVCHCSMCQRATGSAFAIEPAFLKSNVEFTGKPVAGYSYRSPDHGRLLHFTFCATCGTRVGLSLERLPLSQIVYGGTFDEPGWLKPDCQIFMRSAVPWVVLSDDVERFEKHIREPDGTLAQALRRDSPSISAGVCRVGDA